MEEVLFNWKYYWFKFYIFDRVQDSLKNKSSEWLDYIELSIRLYQFEMFGEH